MKKSTLVKILFAGVLLAVTPRSINNHFKESKKRDSPTYQSYSVNDTNYKERISSSVRELPRQLQILNFYDRINPDNLCKVDQIHLNKFNKDSSAGRGLMLNSELMESLSWIDPKNLTTRDKICMQVFAEYVRGPRD